MDLARHYLDESLLQLRKLKAQADKALAQTDDANFFALLDPEANSIALVMKHLSGNMRSRWTNFLTADGEKPDRDRDAEFVVEGRDTRASVVEAWEDGWTRAFDAIASLTPDDLQKTVQIRGEPHSVVEAIDRQVTHYAAHVGQIVLLAKHFAGAGWRSLSIPRGQSKLFEVAKHGGAYDVVQAGVYSRPVPASPAADGPSSRDAVREPGGDASLGADDGAWQHFLQYLRTAPPLPGPQEVLQHYQRTLAAEGLTRGEAERRVGTLLRLMRRRSEAWPMLFDRIYASGAPNVSETPNPLLMSAVEGRPPGRALEVAVGHGRNAVALAGRGWDVTGIDVSEEGLTVARANAERGGVRLTLHHQTDERFDFGSEAWDLIAVIYGPVSITDEGYVQRLRRALTPGGLVVVESFASDTHAPRRKPVDIDPADLLQAFRAFRIARFEDIDGVSEWDPQPTRLVRLVAQKKPDTPAFASS